MKVSYNKIKEFVSIEAPVEEIEKILTNTGLEVEHLDTYCSVRGGLQGLIVGEVLTCEKHPNADKLSLTTVNIGAADNLKIVCGAPNVAVGQKVVVAPVGCTIYPTNGEPFKIKAAKIRGEESHGMLCAEDEIGLGASHDGILILPPQSTVGNSVQKVLSVESDTIIEIGLTANRGDAASHYGIARELATVLNLPLDEINDKSAEYKGDSSLELKVENASYCPLFAGVIISDVKVKESPQWLKNFLNSLGVNSINNVVDISNYVLHVLGQPLHFYDEEKIVGNLIQVRNAQPEELFVALDGKTIKLKGEELVVADSEKVLCLAGVYGGLNSGVTEQTNRIFIESAYFQSNRVRKTAKLHQLATDASFRFERGTNPLMVQKAISMAVDLLVQYADAKVSSHLMQNSNDDYLQDNSVTLNLNSIQRIGGFNIPTDTVIQILKSLGIKIKNQADNVLELSVPLFKSDVTREIDVIEELIRIYGLQHVPLNKQFKIAVNYDNKVNARKLQNDVSALLIGNGFNEIITNSMEAAHYYEDTNDLVKMANPLSSDTAVMRREMLHSGLKVIAYNKNRKVANTHFFEFGKTYFVKNGKFIEENVLALYVSGWRTNESWEAKQLPADYYFLQSMVNRLLNYLQLPVNVANISEVSTSILSKHDIKEKVFYATISWDKVLQNIDKSKFELKQVPIYPEVRRDLSLVVNKDVIFNQIKDIASKNTDGLLQQINVFDIYQGKPLLPNQKAVSISLHFYSSKGTLNDVQIDKIMEKLMQLYETNLNAIIRR